MAEQLNQTNRRNFLKVAAATASALALPAAAALAAPKSAMDPAMEQCIQNCRNCRDMCLALIRYCLKMGGAHAEPGHIRLLTDCAEMCDTNANFMERGSDFYKRLCALCADICDSCAASCEQFPNDRRMRECAAMCRMCAASCRDMAMM